MRTLILTLAITAAATLMPAPALSAPLPDPVHDQAAQQVPAPAAQWALPGDVDLEPDGMATGGWSDVVLVAQADAGTEPGPAVEVEAPELPDVGGGVESAIPQIVEAVSSGAWWFVGAIVLMVLFQIAKGSSRPDGWKVPWVSEQLAKLTPFGKLLLVVLLPTLAGAAAGIPVGAQAAITGAVAGLKIGLAAVAVHQVKKTREAS